MLRRYQFRLLQISQDADPDYRKDFLFADYDTASERGIDLGQYTEAASGTTAGASIPEACENLFETFNRPSQAHHIRSMSVSDIVELTDDDGQMSLWYCDSFGFKNLSNTPTEGGTKP